MKARIKSALAPARRLTPGWLAPVIVRVRLRRALRSQPHWDRARAEMELLLGAAHPDADLDEAARRYIEAWVWRGEKRWHPSLLTNQRVVGIENLVAAQAQGRGVLLSFMHHGDYSGAFASIAKVGVSPHVIVAPKVVADGSPHYLKEHHRVAAMGTTVVSTEVGSAGIADLLQSGAVVGIASDVVGQSVVEFAGRRFRGSSGAARLAHNHGSPVVLLTTRRDAQGPYLHLAPAVDPGAFATPEDLLAVMLRHHEAAILDWPEAVDGPISNWGDPL